LDQVVDLVESRALHFLREERSRPPGFTKKQSSLVHLGLRDYPTIHDPDPVFLGGELRRGRQAADDGSLILGRTWLLGVEEKRCSD
jgi:hypothetical protein